MKKKNQKNEKEIKKKEQIILKNLLGKMTPENIHKETDWGVSVGKEVWW